MKEKCSKCIYKQEEYRNAGYGMPVQVKESCILETQGKTCEFVPNEKKVNKSVNLLKSE